MWRVVVWWRTTSSTTIQKNQVDSSVSTRLMPCWRCVEKKFFSSSSSRFFIFVFCFFSELEKNSKKLIFILFFWKIFPPSCSVASSPQWHTTQPIFSYPHPCPKKKTNRSLLDKRDAKMKRKRERPVKVRVNVDFFISLFFIFNFFFFFSSQH